jgi:anti-sigma B factor antagonist
VGEGHDERGAGWTSDPNQEDSVSQYVTQASVSSQTTAGGTKVVTLDGEFDLGNVAAVRHRLNGLLESEAWNVVVDLRGVSIVDSTMLSTLISASRRAEQNDRRLVLVRPNDSVWRTFTVTGLDSVFPAYADLREALASLPPEHVAPDLPRPLRDPSSDEPSAA